MTHLLTIRLDNGMCHTRKQSPSGRLCLSGTISVNTWKDREQTRQLGNNQRPNAFSIRAEARCRFVTNKEQVTNTEPHVCLKIKVGTGKGKAQTLATHKKWVPDRLDVVRKSRLCCFQ